MALIVRRPAKPGLWSYPQLKKCALHSLMGLFGGGVGRAVRSTAKTASAGIVKGRVKKILPNRVEIFFNSGEANP